MDGRLCSFAVGDIDVKGFRDLIELTFAGSPSVHLCEGGRDTLHCPVLVNAVAVNLVEFSKCT